MSLFQKFLIFKHQLFSTLSDERKRAKDAAFVELAHLLQHHAKRSLTASETLAAWSLDDTQTEVITNLLKEAKSHETL